MCSKNCFLSTVCLYIYLLFFKIFAGENLPKTIESFAYGFTWYTDGNVCETE
jgi:hypothetical protein